MTFAAQERGTWFKGWGLPALLLAPQLVIVLVFFYWPSVRAVFSSFFLEDAFGQGAEFVGLENFERLFADSDYADSFGITVVFSLLVTGIGLSVSLVLAWFADRAIKARYVFRTMLIIPYAVSAAVAAVLWSFLFAPSVGVVAHWLIKQGLAWNYLVNANHALALIVMTAVWKQIAYNFIFFLAGLQAIPKSMIEASAIDGGGPFKTFFYVTLPLLSPTAFFLLVVNVVYAFFDTFGIIDASTGGGPGTSTSILVYKVYNDGFKALDLGSSSAQSVILMILVVLLTVVQFRFIERRVHYA
ncbi:MAG: sn-glycerol-3-phosphate ABC transporter permease UgpA [Betaproteobacteria bacterium]|jgi:sn-glycerol 3-phosphate transport system permease protein|nr:sn-glycerol-3-phosphate ABC transporter permease UgpA [Pseudomonadota bacterium]NBO94575.1 sn-glycerol-3-phosphate ABC transporter permease UgpA [Betaproteobacteria bacterium]NBP34185.1 sn-glycerol-3-phosphate ABC transporter permease UgpA [Betaproteobacteria bacterium]NBP37315.1 sn-glycerol-3-phosphate ABC transporter permease UgpA [Betaproteobacteria bacterium]NBQ77992.1 sn-glycerol-3-phosphate ABC transporter permease UgpA [Betaproteobacteria bacterium]